MAVEFERGLQRAGRRNALEQLGKRIMDLTIGSTAFLFALPVLVVLALWIKSEDGGPIIYRRRVVGPGGDFDAFKLRTMRVDADDLLHSHPELQAEYQKNFKLKDDPRVTRAGNILRRWSFDELPQLVNVIRGQMSLVGPRMITRPELEKYGDYAGLLLTVKPGLTGHWQVNGRQDVSYDQRVQMDVFYLNNWSLWFDCKILFLTAWTVLKRKGAY